jgi:anti-anti-sigma regulatory factor
MDMIVDNVQGRVPITILRLNGALDSSNYELVIAKAREMYEDGTRYLLLDLGKVPFMGSSGLIALHSVALLMNGQRTPNPEYGWQAFHDVDHDRDVDLRQHLRLLNPQPKIVRTLEMTGMAQFFDIYTDQQSAVDAF